MNSFKEWREQERTEILDEAALAVAMKALKTLIGKVSKSADKMALERIYSAEAEIESIKNKDKMILMKSLDAYDVADKELAVLKKTYLKESFNYMNYKNKNIKLKKGQIINVIVMAKGKKSLFATTSMKAKVLTLPDEDGFLTIKYFDSSREDVISVSAIINEDFMMDEESKKVQYIPSESAAIGVFTEKSNGKRFEIYPLMKNDSYAKQIKATHMIHVGTRKFSREYLRYVKLKKTVAQVAVDEAGGKPIWEKWYIKQRYAYEENIEQLKVADQYIINPI